MIIPIILAGGSGTRLWPLSRQLYPKQLIRLVDDNTLLQNTLLRLQCLDNVADPMVICHQDHRFMAADTDPDAVLLVLPADHVIDNIPAGGGRGH